MDTLIISKQEIDCKRSLSIKFVPKSIFMTGEVISINDSTTLKHEKMKFQRMTDFDVFKSKNTKQDFSKK